MIIEFFGLPGTGKTTVVSYLSNMQTKYSIIPEGKEIPKIMVLKNAMTHDYVLFSLLAWKLYARKTKKDKTDLRSLKFMLKTYLKYKTLDSRGLYFLNDHGIVQCLSSLVWLDDSRVGDANRIIEYTMQHMANKVNFLYAFNSDFQRVLERNALRGTERRLLHLSEEEKKRLWAIQSGLFQFAHDLSIKYNCGYVIDTNESVESNASYIAKFFSVINSGNQHVEYS